MLENVMLIDDDQFVIMMNELLLKSAEFTKNIVSTTGVDEAMAILNNFEQTETKDSFPELIFLDLDMPDKSGWDFLKEVQETYPLIISNSKIIILSSSVVDDHYSRVKQYPIVIEIIHKPLKLETIHQLKMNEHLKGYF